MFEAMLENASRICQAKFGVLWLAQGGGFRPAAIHNLPPALSVERQRNEVLKPIPDDPLGQLAATKQMIHIFDSPDRGRLPEGLRTVCSVGGHWRRPDAVGDPAAQGRRTDRRICNIPPGGASVHRQADRAGRQTSPPKPSSPSRTRAFSPSCANRCSSRPPPPRCLGSSPVRQASFSRCSTPCWRMRCVSAPPASVTSICATASPSAWSPSTTPRRPSSPSAAAGPIRPSPIGPPGRMLQHARRGSCRRPHGRSVLSRARSGRGRVRRACRHSYRSPVPMLKDGEPIGYLSIYRQEVRPFSDRGSSCSPASPPRPSSLSRTLVAQRTARIAASSRPRPRRFCGHHSSSPGELKPVFQAMLENAVRICEANFGNLFTYSDRFVSCRSPCITRPRLTAEFWRAGSHIFARTRTLVSACSPRNSKSVVHIADLTTDSGYIERHPRFVAR